MEWHWSTAAIVISALVLCCLLICGIVFSIYFGFQYGKKENAPIDSGNEHKETKCRECGSKKIGMMECAVCHEPAKGCLKCFARIGQCGCDEKPEKPPSVLSKPPSVLSMTVVSGDHEQCPCGNDNMAMMECVKCHQSVMGCPKCFFHREPCDCDVTVPHEAMSVKGSNVQNPQHKPQVDVLCKSAEVNGDRIGHKSNGGKKIMDILSRFREDTRLPVYPKEGHQEARSLCEPCELCEPCKARASPKCPGVEKSVDPSSDDLMNAVRSLKSQMGVLTKKNGELASALSKCEQDAMIKEIARNGINFGCINQSEPLCDLVSTSIQIPHCNQTPNYCQTFNHLDGTIPHCNQIPRRPIPRCHTRALRKLHHCQTSRSELKKKLKMSMKQNAELIDHVTDMSAKLKAKGHKKSKRHRVYCPKSNPYV